MKPRSSPHQSPGRQELTPAVQSLRALNSLASGVVVIAALYLGRSILIPITLAVLLSFIVAPLVGLLRRFHFGQSSSVIVAVLFTLSALSAVGVLIGAQVAQVAGDLPQYQWTVEHKIRVAQENTVGRADAWLASASNALKRFTPPPGGPHRKDNPVSTSGDAPLPVEVHEPTPSPIELAQRYLSPVVSPMETAGIVLVVTIFILLERELLRDRMIRLFGSDDLHRTSTAIGEAAARLSRYFAMQLAINAGVGAFVAIGLAILGMPGALLFGVLTALLRFVPYIGAWIAALMAVVMAVAVSPGWWMAAGTAVLFAATEGISSQLIEPLLYGRGNGLSPLAVIIAAIFWSWLWGPVGLVLSTPLMLCLVTLSRHVERLEFLDVLFGDRPGLTPAENLYQRLLANDPTEALLQAGALLKDCSLAAYYDDAVLAGLRIAHADVRRDVVPAAQLKLVRSAANTIIAGLKEVGDATTIASDGEPVNTVPVLCIGGRGKLDDLLAAIAVQLLNKHGFEASQVNCERFAAGRFDEARLASRPIVCVISFDAREPQPYLRNLLLRLSEARGSRELILGMHEEGESGTDASPVTVQGRTIRVVASFQQLLQACAQAAQTLHEQGRGSAGPADAGTHAHDVAAHG
ncbi:AI-2E family transporter [Paraburkholderia sp. MMS20-SJTN17]|uniref:AI-2E family transporter n=1 Tax=Paraburkholderia translucens TaxID=2886945 RepID=A0ABS8KM79_9BURK|nr:AI-2E family transporter [Paraburkholderia sp. MMS20-SJTN17]MCC8405871.1 AI-2E family transporter [Paraburkholderia sp. MMS20-SJTN17]